MIAVLVVMTAKHQSACHLSGLCHQFGAVPNSLELLRYRKLPIVVILWYQDVHLRALGTDDVTVKGVLAQVDLATLSCVDGNGGNSSQHL